MLDRARYIDAWMRATTHGRVHLYLCISRAIDERLPAVIYEYWRLRGMHIRVQLLVCVGTSRDCVRMLDHLATHIYVC